MKGIIVARYRIYDSKHPEWYKTILSKDFNCAEDYLEWKQEDPEVWNPRNESYLELIKVYTLWLSLDRSDCFERY